MFPTQGGAHPPPEELFAGRYAVDGQLPWGGRASYYRAASEGSPLIICVLPMDVTRSTRAEAGFSRLVDNLRRVRERSLPRILDAGTIDGVPYLAFQDTRGPLLSEMLRDSALPSATVMRVATGVLRALGAAHDQGLVHGDLTPQNIVVTRERNGTTSARIIGTGILPLLRAYPEACPQALHTGSGRHAVAYMAPELIGTGSFPASADLYAAGVLLHHMVRGAPPVVLEEEEGFEDIPGLPDIVRRAMARQPSSRYPSAASMLAALEWLEVESSKLNPQTQDIAPWMEASHVGSVPVPTLASSRPPTHVSGAHPVGTVLSTSGARERPVPPKSPLVIEGPSRGATRYWLQIGLLLLVLGGLVMTGHWWSQQVGARPGSTPTPEHAD
ncbi:MAG: protein kinase [Myxococcota bacterium]